MHIRRLLPPLVAALTLATLTSCALPHAAAEDSASTATSSAPASTATPQDGHAAAVEELLVSVGAQDWPTGRPALEQAAAVMTAPADVPPAVLDQARTELTTWLNATTLDPDVITAPSRPQALGALLMQDAFPPAYREAMTKMWATPLTGDLPAGMTNESTTAMTSMLGADVQLVGAPRVHATSGVHTFADHYDDDARTPFRAATFILGATIAYPVLLDGAPTLLVLQRTNTLEADLDRATASPLPWVQANTSASFEGNQSCEGQHQARWIPDTTLTSAQLAQTTRVLLEREARTASYDGPPSQTPSQDAALPSC